jgi:hypothetical protein
VTRPEFASEIPDPIAGRANRDIHLLGQAIQRSEQGGTFNVRQHAVSPPPVRRKALVVAINSIGLVHA